MVINVWDAPGKEDYQNIVATYYKGTSIAVIVYDISNRYSFIRVEKWIRNI